MITNCRNCGHYQVLLGAEVEGARTMIKKLRLMLADPAQRTAVIDQLKNIKQLAFEAERLLSVATGEVTPGAFEISLISKAAA